MSIQAWKWYAGIGTAVLTVAAALGWQASIICFIATSTASAYVIHRSKPLYPNTRMFSPWCWLIASMLLFAISYCGFFYAKSTDDQLTFLISQAINLLGFIAASAGAHRLAQVRDRDGDKTSLIDSSIALGGVVAILWVTNYLPLAMDKNLLFFNKFISISAATSSAWLIWVAVRLYLGPGFQAVSMRFLVTAAITSAIGQAFYHYEASPAGTFTLYFSSLAVLAAGTSSLHDDVVILAKPAPRNTRKATTQRRLTLMGISATVAPIVLLVQAITNSVSIPVATGLVISWLVTSGLVIYRLVELIDEAAALSEDLHRQRSDARTRSIIENSTDVIIVVAPDNSITFKSPAADTLFGDEYVYFQDILKLIHPEDLAFFNQSLERSRQEKTTVSIEFRTLKSSKYVNLYNQLNKQTSLRNEQSERLTHWFEARVVDMQNDEHINGTVITAHDVTDRKALEEDLRHRVLHDDLTKIPNRVLFRDRINQSLRQRKTQGITAVIFIDVDDFKTVNDSLGHAVGDELLQVVALRLESFIRAGDTAARLGGDEFAVLLENVHNTEEVITISNRLAEAVSQPLDFGTRELNVTVSIGVVIAEHGDTAETLLRSADAAMYVSKRNGKNRVEIFDRAMYMNAIERLDLKAEIARSVQNKELILHYQPIINLQNICISSFEALIRWNHPRRGLLHPGEFVTLAEETGAINEIGQWVIEESIKQLAIWQKIKPEIMININMAPKQLGDDKFLPSLIKTIHKYSVDPSSVILELTESEGLEDPSWQEKLLALRSIGCQIAADDFGTGFASYAALRKLPFTEVKIDRSLTTGIGENDNKAHAQLKSIMEMGHALGLNITAEGVEDAKQTEVLINMGCNKAQGWHFGKPVPADQCISLLEDDVKLKN